MCVSLYDYDVGGDSIFVIKGVVLRVELKEYSYSLIELFII